MDGEVQVLRVGPQAGEPGVVGVHGLAGLGVLIGIFVGEDGVFVGASVPGHQHSRIQHGTWRVPRDNNLSTGIGTELRVQPGHSRCVRRTARTAGSARTGCGPGDGCRRR